MKIIKASHNRSIVFITCLLLSYESDFYNWIKWLFEWRIISYQIITSKIFLAFNTLIGELLMWSYPNSSSIEEKEKLLAERKEIARIMLSILQDIDNSTFKVSFPYPGKSLSTRVYIRIMTNFIDGIVADSLAGAQVVNFHLMQFGKKHSGKIPSQEPFREKIMTLLVLWRFYARRIVELEYANSDVDAMRPIFLAQLVQSQFGGIMDEIFTHFNNTQIVSKATDTLFLSDVNTLPSSLVESKRKTSKIGYISRILINTENWPEKTRWKLKALRKLLSSQLENFSIKN
jgi:hypothetical protein